MSDAAFDNAAGNFNPELDSFWIKSAWEEMHRWVVVEADEIAAKNLAIAEYANQWRIVEVLQSMGWKTRGMSNLSASAYLTKDIGGEGDPESLDFIDWTYEVRVSDHDDYYPADDTIKARFQINFRAEPSAWSDLDLGPDLSTADIRERLADLLPQA
jgi:hypothetical protein